jgi:hypothetical protein
MKLRDILDVISGGTNIFIYTGNSVVFSGKMSEISTVEWAANVERYMDNKVIRINAVGGAVTISV